MSFKFTSDIKLNNASAGGVFPPAGFVFLADADGALLQDADGAYLMEPV